MEAALPPDSAEIAFAPSERGAIGAFAFQGPYPLGAAPELPRDGGTWTLVTNRNGVLDLNRDKPHNSSVAFLSIGVTAKTKGRYYALLGVDDGASVFVDGRAVYARDEARPFREDDDFVPLDLEAGKHTLVFRLKQRDGAWMFAARFVGLDLLPSRELSFSLPRAIAKPGAFLGLTSINFDRGLVDAGLRPSIVVQAPAGVAESEPIPVSAKLVAGDKTLYALNLGTVHAENGIAKDLGAFLPAIPEDEIGEHAKLVVVAGSRTLSMSIATPKPLVATVRRAHAAIERGPHDSVTEDTLLQTSMTASRLTRFVDDGDTDDEGLVLEATELARDLDAIEKGEDPYPQKRGVMRRAYLSPADGAITELGVYVPKSYDPGKKWPLIVTLHGLDGLPLAMIRWFFGYDEPHKEQPWEDRHPQSPMPQLDAIVVSANGHGNTMYRELGEDDVLRVIAWAKAHYTIDDARVTISGPSMGGIGAAAVSLHHPDLFAAAQPLCGYHSYFVRRDIGPRPRRPWEQLIAEERSNVYWAGNGARLPLFIAHGTRDLPVENSGVLIDRYEKLGFSVEHEHPDEGHFVWPWVYQNLRGANWLLKKRRAFDPKNFSFDTTSPREGDLAGWHVDATRDALAWAHFGVRTNASGAITVTTKNVDALRWEPTAGAPSSPVTSFTIDNQAIAFDPNEHVSVRRTTNGWEKGSISDQEHRKHGHVTGPIRDVFHEPIVFVYGASSPLGTAANEAVARGFARIRYGIDVHYPVMSDVEFLARKESLTDDRALFLVGNAEENQVVRALEKDFPIRVASGKVTIGASSFATEEVGAMFIRPNPAHPSSYVVVVESPTPVGTMRSLSLPDILPDFVVYDRRVAPSRNQLLLGAGALVAGGMFGNDWSLPSDITDPLAKTARPSPANEHDATPYLP